MLTKDKMKNHITFFGALAAFALVCFVRYFKGAISYYNTTFFALSYDYGFIPNGFMGSLWKMLDELLPYDLMQYVALYNFSALLTIVYFVCLFCFYKVSMNHCKEEHHRNLQHLILFLSIFAFPMFVKKINFGQLDLYLFILMLIGVIIIIEEKGEWLIIPIGIICTCIQQDFIFSNANTLFVLLFYKILLGNPKKRKQYIAIILMFFLSISALFLYFTYFRYGNGADFADEIIRNAKALSSSGKSYHKFFVKGEILGLDMHEMKAEYQLQNQQDFPVFLVLFTPYIYYGVRFFIRLIINPKTAPARRFAYLAFLLGGATMIPQFLLEENYGLYIFHLIFYYVSLLITAFAMNDEKIIGDFEKLKQELKQLLPLSFVWLLYPLLITPFNAVTISTPIHNLAEVIFTELSFFLQQ